MYTPQSLVKESIELISLPDVYVRLRSIINSPNSSMSDVAQVLVHDPAITARLLKLVNSSFFGLPNKVDTMTHAINMLGTEQVHDLVLATVVVDSFSGFTNDSFNIYDFWFNGVYCAVTSRLLAYHCDKLEDTERPFIEGLLHNIGHMVMYQKMPELALEAAELSASKGVDLHLAEREAIGFDYAQVGAELMREWKLPKSLQEVTEFQNEPGKASQYKLEASLLHISTAITRNALAENPISPETLNVNPICWDITGLSVESMAGLKHEVDQQASMVMSMLFKHKKSA